jgi:uncharacterized protein YkwD
MRGRTVLIVCVVALVGALAGWGVGAGVVSVDIGEAQDALGDLGGDDWNETEIEADILAEINDRRANVSLPPVRDRERIATAAELHADDMQARGYYNHTTPEGVGVRQRYSMCNRQSEIINAVPEFKSYYDPDELVEHSVDQWMESDPHREIMLGSWGSAGVGINITETDSYFVVGFC